MTNDIASTWDEFCAVIQGAMSASGVPGVAVGILRGEQMRTAGFGVTNVDHPLPVTDETFFQIGSITKTFVGTAIMRLAEAGQVDLDATVRTYIPDFTVVDDDASARATIRHLLTHTSGWAGDHFLDTGAGEDALARYVESMSGLEQLAPVGAHYSYNNAGFCLAGRVIEVVTDRNFGQALRELVLDPLGLESSFLDPGRIMTRRFACGHDSTGHSAQVATPWLLPRYAWAAGGIICTVQDLLRYARFHLGDGSARDGTRLLSEGSIKVMKSPQVTIRENEHWGLSWGVEDRGGVRAVRHGGGTVGQVCSLTLAPRRGLAIAIVTNANEGGTVTHRATDWALRHYADAQIVEPEPAGAAAEELAQYEGWYRRPFAEIELALVGGRLVGQQTYKQGFPSQDVPPPPPPPPAVYDLCGKDRLLVVDGPGAGDTADIVRRPDGSIGWLRIGRLYRRD